MSVMSAIRAVAFRGVPQAALRAVMPLTRVALRCASVSTADIKRLRELTDAPLVECKSALVESGGNIDTAVSIIRKKGLGVAAKKADRVANQGVVAVHVDKQQARGGIIEVCVRTIACAWFSSLYSNGISPHFPRVVMSHIPCLPVQLNCETDFVARNDMFLALAKDVVAQAAAHVSPRPDATLTTRFSSAPAEEVASFKAVKTETGEGVTVERALVDAVARIRENIVLRRVGSISFPKRDGLVSSYVHNPLAPGCGGVGILVALQALDASGAAIVLSDAQADALAPLGRKIAMQVAAVKPVYISKEEVPSTIVGAEKQKIMASIGAGKKPQNVLDAIMEGKLSKFYAESTLSEQPFFADDSVTVRALLADAAKSAGVSSIKVAGWLAYHLGEAAAAPSS